MRLCERCHKERDEADFADIAGIGVFCGWCRGNIQEVIDKYGVEAAKGWTYEPRTDLIDFIEGENRTVLDVGCWAGYTMEELTKRGHKVYGIDIQDNRKTALDCPFFKINLEYPEGSQLVDAQFQPYGQIDYALFGDVLEHLQDPMRALEWTRDCVLAPGGKIVISVPNMGWIGAVLQIANQHFPRDESGHFDKTHMRFYTLDQLIATVTEAGFRPTRYKFRQFPDTPEWPSEDDKELRQYQWDNLIITCDRVLYDQLNTYQILLEATPA